MTNIRVVPEFSVVIPSRDCVEYLVPCIESVFHALGIAGTTGEIIVVDHESRDNTSQIVRDRFGSSVALLRVDGGTIAAARNHGAAAASGAVLSFIDSDCTVNSRYFLTATAIFRRPEVTGAGSKVRPPDGGHWIEDTWLNLHRIDRDRFVHHINSGNFLVRREAFCRAVGFDDRLLTGEDAELCQRLVLSGEKLLDAQDLVVYHHRNPRSVVHFLQKEVWHAVGMFGTCKWQSIDRPTIATAVHLVFMIAGLIVFRREFMSVMGFAALIASQVAVPIAAVAHRVRLRGGTYRTPTAVFLYWLYFLARIVALPQAILHQVRRRRRQRPKAVVEQPHFVHRGDPT